MIKVTYVDFQKLISVIKKEAMEGATLSFKDYGYILVVETVDRSNKSIKFEIWDESHPNMPKVTRTETF